MKLFTLVFSLCILVGCSSPLLWSLAAPSQLKSSAEAAQFQRDFEAFCHLPGTLPTTTYKGLSALFNRITASDATLPLETWQEFLEYVLGSYKIEGNNANTLYIDTPLWNTPTTFAKWSKACHFIQDYAIRDRQGLHQPAQQAKITEETYRIVSEASGKLSNIYDNQGDVSGFVNIVINQQGVANEYLCTNFLNRFQSQITAVKKIFVALENYNSDEEELEDRSQQSRVLTPFQDFLKNPSLPLAWQNLQKQLTNLDTTKHADKDVWRSIYDLIAESWWNIQDVDKRHTLLEHQLTRFASFDDAYIITWINKWLRAMTTTLQEKEFVENSYFEQAQAFLLSSARAVKTPALRLNIETLLIKTASLPDYIKRSRNFTSKERAGDIFAILQQKRSPETVAQWKLFLRQAAQPYDTVLGDMLALTHIDPEGIANILLTFWGIETLKLYFSKETDSLNPSETIEFLQDLFNYIQLLFYLPPDANTTQQRDRETLVGLFHERLMAQAQHLLPKTTTVLNATQVNLMIRYFHLLQQWDIFANDKTPQRPASSKQSTTYQRQFEIGLTLYRQQIESKATPALQTFTDILYLRYQEQQMTFKTPPATMTNGPSQLPPACSVLSNWLADPKQWSTFCAACLKLFEKTSNSKITWSWLEAIQQAQQKGWISASDSQTLIDEIHIHCWGQSQPVYYAIQFFSSVNLSHINTYGVLYQQHLEQIIKWFKVQQNDMLKNGVLKKIYEKPLAELLKTLRFTQGLIHTQTEGKQTAESSFPAIQNVLQLFENDIRTLMQTGNKA